MGDLMGQGEEAPTLDIAVSPPEPESAEPAEAEIDTAAALDRVLLRSECAEGERQSRLPRRAKGRGSIGQG